MTDFSLPAHPRERLSPELTPAGIQPRRVLLLRRLFFTIAVSITCVALAFGIFLALGLSRGPWPLPETAVFVLSLLALPWFATGLWNALIGFLLLGEGQNGLHRAAPYLQAADERQPLRLAVAICMTIRNEDPSRALARLAAIRDSLQAFGEADVFDYFLLSDTSDPHIAAAEEAACRSWEQGSESQRGKLIYRRRERNTDFKAGNIRDFLERWGADYELFLPLDADSVMSADAIIRLIRVMQAYPQLGILQNLTAGTPAVSAFARIFQFGMRHAMRSYTIGSAWWIGDCGPYWGHNALIRVKPFRENCELPILPGNPPFGGPILSHDQVEAALMRRAGYEVRVVPVEGGSYEDNPPTLLEFVKRDVRWGQGNLQYWRFLDWPGLKSLSRVQIALAMLMYLGSAATALAIAIAIASAALGGLKNVNSSAATLVFSLIVLMGFAPKLAGLASLGIAKGGTVLYGGTVRLITSAMIEFIFNWFVSVITSFRSTLFMASLVFGEALQWGGQARDAHRLSWKSAALAFWPETLCGLSLFALLLIGAPLQWAIPIIGPLALSIPFAVLTSSETMGRLLAAARICAIPEEFVSAEILDRLAQRGDGESSTATGDPSQVHPQAAFGKASP